LLEHLFAITFATWQNLVNDVEQHSHPVFSYHLLLGLGLRSLGVRTAKTICL
jgi:hypothetical protein